MNPRYPLVADRAGHRREYCRAPEAIFNLPFEVEHILPTSRGGPDEPSNLAPSCRACNLFKADQIAAFDAETRAEILLFDPRTEPWEQHFSINQATGEIVGLTPVGRATVAGLPMNRPVQLAARLQWMRLGIFPGATSRVAIGIDCSPGRFRQGSRRKTSSATTCWVSP
jgi:hypothetical protein